MRKRDYHFIVPPSDSYFQELVKRAKIFRGTQAWQKGRVKIKARDLFLCQVCLKEHYINPHKVVVHHIVPIVEDYSRRLESGNLIALCPHHHAEADCGNISRDYLHRIAIESYEDKASIKHKRKEYKKIIYIPVTAEKYI